MQKKIQHLHGGLRGFAAAAAIASLAAFGCSTNRTPGNGQPAMTAPSTPSSTPGTSSGTSNPPMASTYAAGASVDRANESAAIVAAHQRERYLGTINPSGPQPNPAQPSQPTGQLIPPSAYANPQATVNASISSDPIPVITGGDGSGAVFLGSTGTTAAATLGATTGTTAAPITGTTPTPTTAAITTPSPTMTSTTATPTTAAITTTPTLATTTATPTTAATAATPTAAASTNLLTPTLTSAATPSPTRAANPPLGSLRLTQATTNTASSTTATASSTATRSAGGRLVAPIRVITNADGTVTVTNTTSSTPAVITNHK